MTYTHIRDCWNQIEQAKTVAAIEDLFEQFPRWSGDWELEINGADDTVIVVNRWYDENLESEDEAAEEYDGSQFADFDEYKEDLISD